MTILFILFGRFYEKATAVAILISTLTAVIWYVLAMLCLIVLRRKEPALFRPYKVPAYPALPVFVAVLSGIAGCLYVWSNVQVILPTAALYVAAGIWYAVWARKRVLPVAPEEVAARIAQGLARQQSSSTEKEMAAAAATSSVISRATGPFPCRPIPVLTPTSDDFRTRCRTLAGCWNLVTRLMILRARGILTGSLSEATEVGFVIVLWSLLFVLVSAIGLMSARNHGR